MKRRKIIRNGYRDRRDRELFEAAVSRLQFREQLQNVLSNLVFGCLRVPFV